VGFTIIPGLQRKSKKGSGIEGEKEPTKRWQGGGVPPWQKEGEKGEGFLTAMGGVVLAGKKKKKEKVAQEFRKETYVPQEGEGPPAGRDLTDERKLVQPPRAEGGDFYSTQTKSTRITRKRDW